MSKFNDLISRKKSYRKRRLMDLISMLPFWYFFVFIPLIWVANAELGPRISVAMIYLFGVWMFLSFCQILLINYLKKIRQKQVQKLNDLR